MDGSTPDHEVARIAAYAGAAAVAAAVARSEDIVACHDTTRLAAIRGFAQARAWQGKLAESGVDPAELATDVSLVPDGPVPADLDFDRIAEDTLDAAAGVELAPVPRSEFGATPEPVAPGQSAGPVNITGRVIELEHTRSPEVELEAW